MDGSEPKHAMTSHPSIRAVLLGRPFSFTTALGLFSTLRVDDGTKLLLEHLPPTPPKTVLDLGCGYGALGLPIAAAHPDARFVLVDRDLLAVEMSGKNAVAHGLTNVTARGSLGYRDIGDERFDWVLCNVPARIGDEAIAYILGAGAARLNNSGELRVVVIRDLGPVVERIAKERGWKVDRIADGERHIIYRTTASSAAAFDHESIYARDIAQLPETPPLERPHDISEDPGHLREGLPLLLECLPKKPPAEALVWRGGYGAAAITLASRGAQVTAADKDLLATTFTRRNAARNGRTITTIDTLSPERLPVQRFPLVVGEIGSPAGMETTVEEIRAALARTTPKGTALWLGTTKLVKDWIESQATKEKWRLTKLASRGAYTVVQIRPL
jgi:16S rRNA G1207 methylase RsmC